MKEIFKDIFGLNLQFHILLTYDSNYMNIKHPIHRVICSISTTITNKEAFIVEASSYNST